ncbi:MAG: (2Fe-2S) ferredoxin domain-containing protein [Peptococcales bacterium]|jgi:NADH:ubiquinone oxidoreductase subunit E
MLTINICVGTACHIKGSYNVIDSLQRIISEKDIGDLVTINGAFCLGQCSQKGTSVKINDELEIYPLDEDNLEEFVEMVIIPRIR